MPFSLFSVTTPTCYSKSPTLISWVDYYILTLYPCPKALNSSLLTWCHVITVFLPLKIFQHNFFFQVVPNFELFFVIVVTSGLWNEVSRIRLYVCGPQMSEV